MEVAIALGSNLGDREDNLRRAISTISGAMRLIDMSSVYETEPMYREDQNWFLNCVIMVDTDLGPDQLLEWLNGVERKMGRTRRAERNAPRTIDLDILFYGERVINGPSLEVPHPKIAERAFVLLPLNEIRPRLVHPVLKKTVADLLKVLDTDKRVFKRPGLLVDLLSSRPRQPEQPAASPSHHGS